MSDTAVTTTFPDWSKPVASLLNRFQQHGFELLSVNDGEETIPFVFSNQVTERKEATEVITSVDESWLRVGKDGKVATIFIVLGNEPDELVADYSCGPVLMPLVEEVVNAFSDQWEGKKCPQLEVIV